MKSISGKKFAKLLEDNGWVLLRVNGSHHIYGKSGNVRRLSVPIHGNKALKTGLLRGHLKSYFYTFKLMNFAPPPPKLGGDNN